MAKIHSCAKYRPTFYPSTLAILLPVLPYGKTVVPVVLQLVMFITIVSTNVYLRTEVATIVTWPWIECINHYLEFLIRICALFMSLLLIIAYSGLKRSSSWIGDIIGDLGR